MNLDFAKSDGLVTAVIQDRGTGRVLMVGYMNEDAFRRTVESGYATFYSRSRKKLWLKGESSGHRLAVKSIQTDCDRDAVLIQVEALGPGVTLEGPAILEFYATSIPLQPKQKVEVDKYLNLLITSAD